MKATVMYKAGDVRIDNVPDARIINPKDMASLLTLSDVMGTGHQPARSGWVCRKSLDGLCRANRLRA